MNVDRIKYSKEFNEFGNHIWLGMEAQLVENEDPIESMHQLKKLVESCTSTDYSMMGTIKHSNGYDVGVDRNGDDRTPKEKAIDSQIEAIAGCSSLKSLEIFKKLVDRENVPRLTEAYYKKEQSFK